MIYELESNVDTAIGMLKEISAYSKRIEYAGLVEEKLLEEAITSLVNGIRIINNAIPQILKQINITKELPQPIIDKKALPKEIEKISAQRKESQVEVFLRSGDKKRFLQELRISDELIKKIKRSQHEKKEKINEYLGSRGLLKIANKFFLETASKMIKKGKFKSLGLSIKRANIDILFESYVSLLLFMTFIAFILGALTLVFLLFFNAGFEYPFVARFDGDMIKRAYKFGLIPLILPIFAYLAVYVYPSTEKKSLAARIDQELPFAVIHMSAVSGSGIEPSEIFKIIGLSKEYPYLRKEIRKILNQINLYGYDLVTALNNSSKTAPSEKLSELLSGVSVTITSGANLPNFFEKRSESLLLEYRLEREKYTKVVETFLDIYISIVIAAPMVFLLLLILMNISGMGLPLNSFELGIVSVLVIAVLNIFFLMLLQTKQPTY